MVSLLTFIGELVGSAIQLVVIFLTQVAFRSPFDPLAFVSFAIGGALTTAAVLALAYLALGALVDLVSGDGGSLGRTPPPQR